ncbi:MAG: hypothetical protein K0S09_3177 [Sphingobacteriaceae bacterium]|jgi:hypothetical protein|nr:hypothetical protein [Sphingobacteriaceae bacterium]
MKKHSLMEERLRRIEEAQENILELLRAEKELASMPRLGNMIDAIELAKRLHVTDRTIRRYKKDGVLVPYTLGERDYYVEAEVVLSMQKNGISKK